jgi:RsiW-degrading membrane proteinase PrsW (M82 family)
MVRCWQCSHDVPVAAYCIVCGNSLADEQAARADAAGRYRANPAESARSVSITSTLFPQLPRAELDVFRTALLLGTALVVILTLIELYPVAVAVAATVVPLLVVLYVYEIDVYEDEPKRVVALTLAWGAIAGIGAGFVARSVALAATPSGSSDLIGTLPVAATVAVVQLALILVGPLVLLRYPRFNDVLDGATFGVASAAGFALTYTLVFAMDVLLGGLQPGGDVSGWLLTIVNVALLRPLLLVSVAGAVCAALWLRYRGPARDRGAMGALGQPAVALLAGAVLLVAGGTSGALLESLPATLLRGLLAVIALVWLRRMIHLGLRQEAAEVAIGPVRACPNCGHATAWHSFCGSCGISLRALPKERGVPRVRTGEDVA